MENNLPYAGRQEAMHQGWCSPGQEWPGQLFRIVETESSLQWPLSRSEKWTTTPCLHQPSLKAHKITRDRALLAQTNVELQRLNSVRKGLTVKNIYPVFAAYGIIHQQCSAFC